MSQRYTPLYVVLASILVVLSIVVAVELVDSASSEPALDTGSGGETSGMSLPAVTPTAEPQVTTTAEPATTTVQSDPTEVPADQAATEATPTPRIFPTLTPAPQEAAAGNEEPAQASALPVTLHIPQLGISAPIEYVGRDELGNMDVPEDPWNVAWYEPGFVPGNPGNSVLAGHVDSQSGPAIFWHLRDLQPGAEINVETTDGSRITFVVTRTATYNVADIPLRDVFGSASDSHLNLITCHGTFDPVARDYDQRLIVYTTRVG